MQILQNKKIQERKLFRPKIKQHSADFYLLAHISRFFPFVVQNVLEKMKKKNRKTFIHYTLGLNEIMNQTQYFYTFKFENNTTLNKRQN